MGRLLLALHLEDSGAGICYNVFCYNAQPGIIINYANGDSTPSGQVPVASTPTPETKSQPTTNSAVSNPSSGGSGATVYLSATGSCYHSKNNCGRMNPNKATATTEQNSISQGYSRCSKCW